VTWEVCSLLGETPRYMVQMGVRKRRPGRSAACGSLGAQCARVLGAGVVLQVATGVGLGMQTRVHSLTILPAVTSCRDFRVRVDAQILS
jgi:hypothetical protein